MLLLWTLLRRFRLATDERVVHAFELSHDRHTVGAANPTPESIARRPHSSSERSKSRDPSRNPLTQAPPVPDHPAIGRRGCIGVTRVCDSRRRFGEHTR